MKQIKSKVGTSNIRPMIPHSKKDAHVAGKFKFNNTQSERT
jgi:hypothetical protein